jgi:DUF1680 family protein
MINYCVRILATGASILMAHAAQDYPITPIPFRDVKVNDEFWSPRLETNRVATVPVCFKRCEETGRIDNFSKAGKLMSGGFRGIRYDDSDVFKVIEGASYTLALRPDPDLEKYLDGLINKIKAAQEPDGYLYTCRTINPAKLPGDTGSERWSFIQQSHELYNAGHLYEAAAAHFQATGKRSLLNIAIKNANLIDATFGPGKRHDVPGHEEIEIGLIKLFRATGQKKYLDLAKFFIDQRGNPEPEGHKLYGEYAQDHEPVILQHQPTGHAVRAGYLYSGMADVAAISGEPAYTRALERIWQNLTDKKIYLTGGIGAEAGHEGFGADYDLPNKTAYNETCADVALALWNQRMFLLSGESKYIDLLERVLYNGFLSGVSLRGDTFFYPNPLESDGKYKFNHGSLERSPWFGTACCPVNIVRTLPSVAGYIYAQREDGAYVNLFIAGTGVLSVKGQKVTLTQDTRFPWEGKVKIEIGLEHPASFVLRIRIPGWSQGKPMPGTLYHYAESNPDAVGFKVNHKAASLKIDHGYATVEGTWNNGDTIELDLPMTVHRVAADHRVRADEGRIALQRGPLVYCFEGIDNAGTAASIELPADIALEAEFRSEMLGGIEVVRAASKKTDRSYLAIPYYAWNNRGPGEMEVWVRQDQASSQ